MPEQGSDPELAAAMSAGDQQAFAAIYERYSDRIYSYCASVCGNPELAADAMQDAFLLAFARVDQLRDRSKLRPWLYAIARNECLRQLRAHKRDGDLEKVGEVADVTVSLDTDLNAADARTLIDDAFAGMNSSDREVLDLALRQDLDNASIAAVLGVSDNNAAAKVSRAKSQLEKAVGALLLFRAGSAACEQLTSEIGADQAFTPLARKRIIRHAESCANCTSSKKRSIAAIALVGLPVLVAPPGIREALLNSVAPAGGATTASGASEAGPETSPGAESGATPSPSADGGPIYISESAGGVPPLSLAQKAAQIDKARPAFDGQGWPRSGNKPGRKWPLVAALAGVAVLMAAATGLAITGEAEVPAAGQTQTSSSSVAVPTGEPAPSVATPRPSTKSKTAQPSASGSSSSGSGSSGSGSGSGSGSSSSSKPKTKPTSSAPQPTSSAPTPGKKPAPVPGGPSGIVLPPAPTPG